MKRFRDKKAWIFDMDGTLTIAAHDFAYIRGELELPMDEGILESLARLPPEEAAKKRKRLDEIELETARASRPSPGARELLEELRNRRVHLGIFTRNSGRNVEETLRAVGFAEFFPENHRVDRDTAPPKPDPQGIRLLLSRWNRTPGEAVMVGDYLYDLQASRALGVENIYLDPSEEFPHGEFADFRLSGLDQIKPDSGNA